MNQESYFVIKGLRDGTPVYKTKMRTRPNAWSPDPQSVKKYQSRKTAEGSLESKFVTLYSVGVKSVEVEEILPNDRRYLNTIPNKV